MKMFLMQYLESKDVIGIYDSWERAAEFVSQHETLSMWEVVITEHEVDMSGAIAYLVEGKVVCPTPCLGITLTSDVPSIQMKIEHFGKYSQNCSKCHKQIVKGEWKTELFPTERDPAIFSWVDMQQLLVAVDRGVEDDDPETIHSVRKTMYERILRAIMVDKLHDRKLVFDALDRVMQVETKW